MKTQVCPSRRKAWHWPISSCSRASWSPPTETVYGIAADAHTGAAVKKIFEAKGRPGIAPHRTYLWDGNAERHRLQKCPKRAKSWRPPFGPATYDGHARGPEVSDVTCAGAGHRRRAYAVPPGRAAGD